MNLHKVFHPIEDTLHDMTKPSPVHNTVIIDTNITDADRIEKMTAEHLLLGEERFAKLNAQATANATAIRKAQQEATKKRSEEAARIRASYADPFSRYIKAYRNKNRNNEALLNFLKNEPRENLEELTTKLEAGVNRYRSLFNNNTFDALHLVKEELTKRKG